MYIQVSPLFRNQGQIILTVGQKKYQPVQHLKV